MYYNIINRLVIAFNKSNVRNVLIDFNKILSDNFSYHDSVFYFFEVENGTDYLKSYRYKSGRLYEKKHNFEHFEHSLLEKMYLEKVIFETDILKTNYTNFYTGEYYRETDILDVITIPLVKNLHLYGVVMINFINNPKVDLKMLEIIFELLNIWFQNYQKYNQVINLVTEYQQIFNNEKIKYHSINAMSDLVLNKHLTMEVNEQHNYQVNQSFYKQVKLSSETNYCRNITAETLLRKRMHLDVYETEGVFNKNKLLIEINSLDSFSLLKINSNRIKLALEDLLKLELKIFLVDNNLVVLFETTDLRIINKDKNNIVKVLNKKLLINYRVGIIRFKKDIKKRAGILDLLEYLTNSHSEYFDEQLLINYQRRNVEHDSFLQAIKDKKIDYILKPIIDFASELKGYLVTTKENQDNLTIEQRMALIKNILHSVKNVPAGFFVIELSDDLISEDFIKFLKSLKINKVLTERLIFKYDVVASSFDEYLIFKGIKIARGNDIEFILNNKIKTDYYLTNFNFNQSSRYFLDLLANLEEENILKSIIFTNDKLSYQFLKNRMVGFIYSNKYFSLSELKE